jgi:hypothetical protein
MSRINGNQPALVNGQALGLRRNLENGPGQQPPNVRQPTELDRQIPDHQRDAYLGSTGSTQAASLQDPRASQQRYNVKLEGFDAAKLANLEHANKSPKYAFGQLVNTGRYDYTQTGEILAELQRTYPDLYRGWTHLPGKEVIRFTGDPSQLHPSWNGVDEVDLVRNFTADEPNPDQGFWWGTSTPAERAGGGADASLTFDPLGESLDFDPMSGLKSDPAQMLRRLGEMQQKSEADSVRDQVLRQSRTSEQQKALRDMIQELRRLALIRP